MTLSLFDTDDKPKPDYMSEIRGRLNKMDMTRNLYDTSGNSIQARLIYTLPGTCAHPDFDSRGNHYACRTEGCKSILTENQIYIIQQ